MTTAISWVFEAAVKPDGLDEYRALAREISADNEAAEPNQVIFEWYIDHRDVHIYERYTDSAAALSHVERFVANFAERFLSLCTPTRMSVYGEPSDELKAAIAGFNPRYFGTVAGHARGLVPIPGFTRHGFWSRCGLLVPGDGHVRDRLAGRGA